MFRAIHILVADVFLEKPIDCRNVMHKDGNIQNNIYTNLKWVRSIPDMNQCYYKSQEGEIWKEIPNSYYSVSNYGNVINDCNQLISPKVNGGGYSEISLIKNNKVTTNMVHRLVAQAFIPNTNNKPTVDHIDKTRTNNHVDNLRWFTYKEQSNNRKKINRSIIITTNIKCENISNGEIIIYDDIEKIVNFIIENNLSKTHDLKKIIKILRRYLNGYRRNTYLGYKWTYVKDQEKENEEWKSIRILYPNATNCFVSNLGRYKNEQGHIYTGFINSGYTRVSVCKN